MSGETSNGIVNCLIIIAKGAVDVLIPRAKFIQDNGQIRPITADDIDKIERQNDEFSRNGLRVLAMAYKKYDEEKVLELGDEYDFVFLGLISMIKGIL